MLARALTRLMDAQGFWTRPLGNFVHGIVHWLFSRLPALHDLLGGRWLGHPLHALLTDVPIGILLLVAVFDGIGAGEAAAFTLAVGIVAMLGAALAGYADYAYTDGKARERASLHSTLMVVALLGYLVALALRFGPGPERFGLITPTPAAAVWISGFSFLVLATGAYVGGDVVYLLGNMVSRHAFRGAGTKWITLEPAELDDASAIPEGRPVRAKLGLNQLVLVRDGDRILALHDTCAHAGGPLSEGAVAGRIRDGTGMIECPWHGSRYRLANGHVVRGPSVYDQPACEVRAREGGGWEARRQAG